MIQQQPARWWDDPTFQDSLLCLLIRDQKSLIKCGSILVPEDFRAVKGVAHGRSRYVVAERVLEFYTKHHEPIGKLLNADVIEYADSELGYGAGQMGDLRNYLEHLRKVKPHAPEALVEKVIKFKARNFKNTALTEMNELMAAD